MKNCICFPFSISCSFIYSCQGQEPFLHTGTISRKNGSFAARPKRNSPWFFNGDQQR